MGPARDAGRAVCGRGCSGLRAGLRPETAWLALGRSAGPAPRDRSCPSAFLVASMATLGSCPSASFFCEPPVDRSRCEALRAVRTRSASAAARATIDEERLGDTVGRGGGGAVGVVRLELCWGPGPDGADSPNEMEPLCGGWW